MLNARHFHFHSILGLSLLFILNLTGFAQQPIEESSGAADSFNAGAPEIEPIVVGREKWNQPTKAASAAEEAAISSQPSDSPAGIGELDPLETRQVKPEPSELPLDPPKTPPATNIIRNFEGNLVFKPRKFGFAYDFPYQLENSSKKRIAYLDFDQLKSVDPQQHLDKRINVMGKLESVDEGSDDLVIRVRALRPAN